MVIQSTVELSDDHALHIYKAVYKHHDAFLALAYAGDMYIDRVLYSWFQSERFNIWSVGYNGANDDYLVEVCPRDYPNDISLDKDKFVRPTEFDYGYSVSYLETEKVVRIEKPVDYWNFYNSDVGLKVKYQLGYESWPRFQIYAHEGDITDVPGELLVDNPYS